MAEIGLVPFARVAREVAGAVLPRYRTRFSKHQFTQPQLLALLCVMRYEDGTFREAEVRLSEHQELRRALGLRAVPDHTPLFRFLSRWPEEALQQARAEVARRVPRTPTRTRVAIDATGLTHRAISTYYHRQVHPHVKTKCSTAWLKWLVVLDVDQQLLLAQAAHRAPTNDCVRLPELVGRAGQIARIGLVLADAEFDTQRNHRFIRHELGARSVIPAKRCGPEWRLHGVRAEMRRAFPQRTYARRAAGKCLLPREAQALGPRSGSLAAHAMPPSPLARRGFQHLSLVVSSLFQQGCQQSHPTSYTLCFTARTTCVNFDRL